MFDSRGGVREIGKPEVGQLFRGGWWCGGGGGGGCAVAVDSVVSARYISRGNCRAVQRSAAYIDMHTGY